MISHDILRVYMILWMHIYDTRNEYIYIYIIKDNRILKYEDRNILIYIYVQWGYTVTDNLLYLDVSEHGAFHGVTSKLQF